MRPVALTIAGSYRGGGGVIQMDIKTFSSFGVVGVSTITSITSQNTTGILEVFPLPPDFVESQINAVCSDIKVFAAKTGMLPNADVIHVVANSILSNSIERVVVDPIIVAGDGTHILDSDGEEVLKEKLFPVSTLITPNIPEAEKLLKKSISSVSDMKEAAKYLMDYSPKYVLIKGGHLDHRFAIDIMFNGSEFYEFGSDRVYVDVHGSGCAYSSAITSMLAWGYDIITSVDVAKKFIFEAIRNHIKIGKGKPIPNTFVKVEGKPS